ncbi:hypothetical protein CCO03_13750 [Comamonas serinivorans]|uniref:Porin domain-containing protein n=1 Tax=Comamonas serinivorans TaxID=1082851 RepID=A0A1Y0EPL8_9BURK|nr:porin [Comamonas serinivorans]ARU05604.1 hypothetical protein CCO03_13750 [Comamonas serinivorans]
MKHLVLAAACAAACPLASAQSQVNLYGTADLMLRHVQSGPTRSTTLVDGGHAASRLGFRGSEDLGDGWRAGFVLEMGINAANGQGTIPGPTAAFTRQSYLSLSGPWGSLEMGRMYTPMFLSLLKTDPFSMNALFSPLNAVSLTDGQTGLRAFSARASNLVRYHAPALGPVTASLAHARGDETGRRSQFLGGNLAWTHQGWYVGYGFQRTRDGWASPPADGSGATGASLHQSLSVARQWAQFKLSGNVMRNRGPAGVPHAQLFSLGASWAVNPSNTLLAEVLHRRVAHSPRRQNVLTLGWDHALSKRTAVYGRLLILANDGQASATLGGVPVVADSGHNLRVFGVGLRHQF